MGLLRDNGYSRARDYTDGLAGWCEAGEALEAQPRAARVRASRPSLRGTFGAAIRLLERTSTRGLARASVAMVILCALAFWLLCGSSAHGLRESGAPLELSLANLPTALYFSAVTATTLGYGDVTPIGLSRLLAVAESIAGLMLFGAVISKFLSQRSEALVNETHHLAFEERLGRLRTNLHLVIAEFDELGKRCADSDVDRSGVTRRMQSVIALLTGELRSVHMLFYRPQADPPEEVIEGLLAGICASLDALIQLRENCSEESTLELSPQLRKLRGLAEDICGDCVPREYAEHLRVWMDRVQETARQLS